MCVALGSLATAGCLYAWRSIGWKKFNITDAMKIGEKLAASVCYDTLRWQVIGAAWLRQFLLDTAIMYQPHVRRGQKVSRKMYERQSLPITPLNPGGSTPHLFNSSRCTPPRLWLSRPSASHPGFG